MPVKDVLELVKKTKSRSSILNSSTCPGCGHFSILSIELTNDEVKKAFMSTVEGCHACNIGSCLKLKQNFAAFLFPLGRLIYKPSAFQRFFCRGKVNGLACALRLLPAMHGD